MKGVALHTTIKGILEGHAPLMALAKGGIVDHVDQDATFPYVVIGEAVSTPHDTDDSAGASHVIDIHTWSRHEGRLETKRMQEEIYAALHRATMSVDGCDFVGCDLELEESFPVEPDGRTRHGVQRYRVLLDEVL